MPDDKKDEKKDEKTKKGGKKGFAVLRAPEGVSSCSVEGTEYDVDEGLVEVSERHVAPLLEHGFQV